MRDSEGALIAARGLALTLGGRPILEAIDIAVRPGEIVSVIGPNGAGKTMLLRVLLGLVAATAGGIRRRPGLRVGYVPQRLQVDSILPLDVRSFLDLAGHARQQPAYRRGDWPTLAEVGVPHLLGRALQQLSGGELQRVLLARALLREPELLVLDEPAQGVDLLGRGEIYALIDRLRRRRGCAVLLVSHDLHVVMAATDWVVCLNRHVCCAGRPDAVSRHPEYIGLFGPEIAAAFGVYAHAHDHAHDTHGDVASLPPKALHRHDHG